VTVAGSRSAIVAPVTGPPLPLPENVVLLHIGVFKTGTTAIQGALFRARPGLAEHGVLHAGITRHPISAVLALTGLKARVGKPPPRMQQWDDLVAQVAAASDKRVVVSSEFFSGANDETARRAVRELGGPRVHVVVTLRPLVKIMPSQWQQYIRNRMTFSYEDWLDGMLNKPPYSKPTPSFWQRHRHDALVERWASIVGPENVTVIVPDENDRGFLLHSFEELLGLPTGLLVAERDTENRSMTLGEIELVRQINREFLRNGWSDKLYRKFVRQGLTAQMQTNRTPAADEPRVTTPQWALDRAAEIGAAAADKLTALGVNIVGDVSTLGAPVLATESSEPVRDYPMVAVDAAREAVIGVVVASGLETSTAVKVTSTKDLVGVILARGRSRLRGKPAPPPEPEPEEAD
jgi:hypothetical protein